MGVIAVHGYPLPEGKSGQQAVEGLCKVLETLGGTKVGNFNVECESYHSSIANQPRILNLYHSSEYPASCFSLLDTGTCMVSDTNFDMIMLAMSGLYQSKKVTKMESKGPKYIVGDFTVKVGSVSMGPSFRGVLIEVEYGPCCVPAYCWHFLKEFMGSFMVPPQDPHMFLQNRMNEILNPVDVIHQYNDHFNQLRKQMAVGGSGFTSGNAPNTQAGTPNPNTPGRATPSGNPGTPANQVITVGK